MNAMTTPMTSERSALYREHIATLVQRYTDALEQCAADRALVFAGVPRLRDRDDQAFPFVAEPYFQQWIPLPDAPGSAIEFRPGHKPHLIFMHDEDFWSAPARAPADAVLEHFEVTRTDGSGVRDCVARPGGRTVTIGDSGHALEQHEVDRSAEFLAYLDFDRAIKTAWELACMSDANTVAAAGHRAVEQALRAGVSEFELHMRYCSVTGHTDEDLPYPSIIGLNEHAAILHYQQRDRKPPATTHSLLIDAGARINGYASDVTRTHCLDEEAFGELIEAMNTLQQRVCARVRAGVDFVALNDFCHELLAGVLAECGFIRCTAEAAFENGVTTAFLPHGLGHLLGLQVHDVGGRTPERLGEAKTPPARHPYLRLTRTLEENMVVTIEPGIYFIEPLIEAFERKTPGIIERTALDTLARCGGIRIEDNLQVESRGHTNLTRIAFGE